MIKSSERVKSVLVLRHIPRSKGRRKSRFQIPYSDSTILEVTLAGLLSILARSRKRASAGMEIP